MDFESDFALSTEQTDKILQFQDLTGIEDISVCRDVLQRHQWDLEVAVQEQLNIREGRPSMFATENRAPAVVHDHSGTHIFYAARPGDENATGLRAFFRNVIGFFWSVCYNTLAAIFQIGVRFIRPDQRQFLTDPLEDVTNFIVSFEEKYGHTHPVFYQGTYSQVLNDAKQELRFLLIYLHRDDTPDSSLFCRDVLTDAQTVNFINSNFLFWAVNVRSGEGYKVSQVLRESRYPFLAVIVLKDNRMTIVGRLEGYQDGRSLVHRLSAVVQDNEGNLQRARAQRVERSLTQTLRAQQDEAYMESLRMDQEKEKRREEQRKAVEDEKKREEEEAKAEEERLRRIKQEKEESVWKVPEEPLKDDPNAVHVVIKLPCGTRLDRRFLKSHSLESIYLFVFSHPKAPNAFEITTNFPKRVLKCQRTSSLEYIQTVGEAGLENREVLFINDLEA